MNVDYSHLQPLQKIAMTSIIVISNFMCLPQIIFVYSKGLIFESFVFAGAFTCSFMYHLTQVFSQPIWMVEEDWHRLDNLFSICSFILFLSLLIGTSHHQYIKYSSIPVTLVIQEKQPFTQFTTFLPITIFFVISIALRLKQRNQIRIQYNQKYLSIFLVSLALGYYFFLIGTNERQDYLRIFHGISHLCAALFTYFGLRSVQFKGGWTKLAAQQ